MKKLTLLEATKIALETAELWGEDRIPGADPNEMKASLQPVRDAIAEAEAEGHNEFVLQDAHVGRLVRLAYGATRSDNAAFADAMTKAVTVFDETPEPGFDEAINVVETALREAGLLVGDVNHGR